MTIGTYSIALNQKPYDFSLLKRDLASKYSNIKEKVLEYAEKTKQLSFELAQDYNRTKSNILGYLSEKRKIDLEKRIENVQKKVKKAMTFSAEYKHEKYSKIMYSAVKELTETSAKAQEYKKKYGETFDFKINRKVLQNIKTYLPSYKSVANSTYLKVRQSPYTKALMLILAGAMGLSIAAGCKTLSKNVSNDDVKTTMSTELPEPLESRSADDLDSDFISAPVSEPEMDSVEPLEETVAEYEEPVIEQEPVEEETSTYAPANEYRVQKGDNLWRIIKSNYGFTRSRDIIPKILELVEHNQNRLPHLTTDNRTSQGPGADGIPGDLIRPGDVIELI